LCGGTSVCGVVSCKFGLFWGGIAVCGVMSM
jgi:hypothetical protein